jgi:CRP/FNR family transcriptional regulator, cyclic AMP receptor protein
MAADPAVTQALGATNLFSSLTAKALERVAGSARVIKHPAGSTLAAEGESGVGLHVITEGTASIDVKGESRGEIGPGAYFGEISLIDGRPRSATVIATTDLTTVSITAWDFAPLLDTEPEVSKALLLVLCARLRAAEQR